MILSTLFFSYPAALEPRFHYLGDGPSVSTDPKSTTHLRGNTLNWYPTRARTCDVMLFLAMRVVGEGRLRGKSNEQIIQELINA